MATNAAQSPTEQEVAAAPPKQLNKRGKGKKARRKGKGGKKSASGGGGGANAKTTSTPVRDDVTLLTAASDCWIKFWQLHLDKSAAAIKALASPDSLSSKVDEPEEVPACTCVYQIKHSAKMNWLASNVSSVRRSFLCYLPATGSFHACNIESRY